MVLQGFFSAVYSAAFNLVSRRLMTHIKNTLYKKILFQDVAYFDGTTSGALLSRLTNDINMMMTPINTSLSLLLSNVLMLLGGVFFCFLKSFRLSMLAFVTVGPIMFLWDQYALWSKRLNREVLASWSEANSLAGEALANIRIVKAFSTEAAEIKQYNAANDDALKAGVKDAWGNGLTTALTQYLDLGTGVLILWFGGVLCIRGEMSLGELISFQLYWSLMNNAYQSLQGLITSFTRSAAGAEKVFSLWDSAPDIDPNLGSTIDWPVEGRLELQNVKFFYQMRPDNIVLESVNLVIPAGSVCALVGRSGGGKYASAEARPLGEPAVISKLF
jgi:ABC-type multidrug transport system fused ATPase/permease subunit